MRRADNVSEYLLEWGCKLSNFYHSLKTHNMPCDHSNIEQWRHETGFPIRGITSGRGSTTERLAGFIDPFL